MITFNWIELRNFLSIGDEPVRIYFREGLNILMGVNHDEEGIGNGVGKSAFGDGLWFVLSGETLRSLTPKKLIINRKVGKNCEGKVDYTVENDHYFVERGLAPDHLRFYKNDKDVTRSNKAETTKAILESLKLNDEIFENCILMRANDTIPFMHKKPAERKSFIESIFSFSVLAEMLKEVNANSRAVKSSLSVSQGQLNVVLSNLKRCEEQISLFKAEQAKKNAAKEETRKTILKEIETEENSISNNRLLIDAPKVDVSSDEKTLAQGKIFENNLTRSIIQAETAINNARTEIEKIDKSGFACPLCHRDYDEHTQAEVEKRKSELIESAKVKYAELQGYRNQQEQLAKALASIQERVDKSSQDALERRFASERIRVSEQKIQTLRGRLDDLNEDDSFVVKSLIDNLKAQEEMQKNLDCEIERWCNESAFLNTCAIILGESGIRKYVVGKLLDIMNERIAFYLRSFKSMFEFTFTENFQEEIKDCNGFLCAYNNCSGAEMKKIDLAISFAFIDILKIQHQTEYNLIIFDEILDSSIDAKSLGMIVNFIGEHIKKNNKSAYVITHKSEVKFPEINERIILAKRNGFTKIEKIEKRR